MAKRILWDHSGREFNSVRLTVEKIDSGLYRVEFLSSGFGHIGIGKKIRPLYERGIRAYLAYANGKVA